LVSPVTVADVALPAAVAVAVPGDAVTVYDRTAPPPVVAGAVHDTVACPFPAVAVTPVGAPGGPDGVTALEAAEAGPVPAALAAVTVNVYAVPLTRPATVAEVADPDAVAVRPPGAEVTVYPVIAEPPVAGAVHDTVAWPFPAFADIPVGAPGTVNGVTAADAAEAAEFPTALAAVTVKV